jgi:hypothetical protein
MPAPRITFDFTDQPLSQSGAWASSVWNTSGVQAVTGHVVQSVNSAHNGMRRVSTLSSDHYAECTIDSLRTSASPLAGPMTRMQGTSNASGYVLTYRPNENVLRLYRLIDNGSISVSSPIGADVSVTIGVNDVVRLASTGSSHAITFNGTLKATYTDVNLTGGQPGLWIDATAKNDIGITQFKYGDSVNGDTTISFDSPLDSNWTNPCGALNTINLEKYYALPTKVATHVASRYETDFGNDQFAEILAGNIFASSWMGVNTRMSTTNANGYSAVLVNAGATNLILYKMSGASGAEPTFTDIGHTTVTVPPNPCDLWLQSTGSTHTVYVNGVQQLQVTDATYATGRVGIAFYANGSLGDVEITQWSGGDNAARQPQIYAPFIASTLVLYPPIHPAPDQSVSLPVIPSGARVWSGIGRNLLLGQSTFGVTEYPLSDNGLWGTDVWNVPSGVNNVWPNLPNGAPTSPPHGMWQLRGHAKASVTAYSGMRRNLTLNSDHYAVAVISCPLTDNNPYFGPSTRMQSSTNASGYAVLYNPLGTTIQIYKIVDNGVSITATALGSTYTVVRGVQDVVGLLSVGSTHYMYWNNMMVGKATDATYTGGQPGLICLNGVGNECIFTEFRAGNAPGDNTVIFHDDTGTVVNFDATFDATWQNPAGVLSALVWEATCAVEAIKAGGQDVGPPWLQSDHHTASRRHSNADSYQWSEGQFATEAGGTWVGVNTRMQSDTNSGGYCLILFGTVFSGNLRLYRVEGAPGTTAFGQDVLDKTDFATPGAGSTTVTSTGLATVAVNAGGTGYAVNDILTVVQGGASGGTVKVTTVSGGVVTGLSIQTLGSGYVNANGLTTTGGTGTGCTVNITSGGFTSWMASAGCFLVITSGTNFVAGTYLITGYTNTNTITLASSATPSGAGSGGVGHVQVPGVQLSSNTVLCPFGIGGGNKTDLATSGAGATVVTSASGGFASWMVGTTLTITGGTNFVAGNYTISGFTNATTITLSSSPTPSGAGSAGTGDILALEPPYWIKLVSQGSTHTAYVGHDRNSYQQQVQVTDGVYTTGQPGLSYFSAGGPSAGRCFQWLTGGDQAIATPFLGSGVVFYTPLEVGIALFANGPKIVYPSAGVAVSTFGNALPAGSTILRLYHLPRFVPYKQYAADRNLNIAASGSIEVIWKRTDTFLEFEMEYVRGIDMSPWEAFMSYALGKGPFDYYPDATQSSFTTYWLESTTWNAAYKALGLNTFKVRFRKRLA